MLMQCVENEVKESQMMEDKLVNLLEDTCARVERTVLEQY